MSFIGGTHPHMQRQNTWFSVDDQCEYAVFAGQEILVTLSNDEMTYRLTYLDMAHPETFDTMQEAKAVAVDFAKAVLQHMITMIDSKEVQDKKY